MKTYEYFSKLKDEADVSLLKINLHFANILHTLRGPKGRTRLKDLTYLAEEVGELGSLLLNLQHHLNEYINDKEQQEYVPATLNLRRFQKRPRDLSLSDEEYELIGRQVDELLSQKYTP
jgi:hypothetical protein